jgi:hypothetical protein
MTTIIRGNRYPDLERQFVRQVCSRAAMVTNGKAAATERLVEHTSERLAKGAEEYGPSQFWNVPIVGEKTADKTPLICELQEEAADILGWGALTAIRFRERGWFDLVTKLEIATTGVISYGDQLKVIERVVASRSS